MHDVCGWTKYENNILDVKHHTDSDDFTPLKLRASFISGPECSGFWEDWFKVTRIHAPQTEVAMLLYRTAFMSSVLIMDCG